ncbi:hypothetical protein HJFPF1_11987 [Paramyrothecium foliicola]|nr:hypothetical protein HJFPF1_11987 [Paramyrothecium foliicola]
MADWEEAALSSRHMHNRVGHSGDTNRGRSNRNSVFDVRKTFGSYSCKCPARNKVNGAGDHSLNEGSTLELYRLTENGQGVVGQLCLPGVLQAAVILAASRDSLRRILSELIPLDQGSRMKAEERNPETRTDDDNYRDDTDDYSDDQSECGARNNPFDTFEKNSFRSPKFWLQWNGILQPTSTGAAEKPEAGLGYIIFTSNDCRKFKGTFNCASLAWKDVSFSGHKITARSESDLPVTWGVAQTPL